MHKNIKTIYPQPLALNKPRDEESNGTCTKGLPHFLSNLTFTFLSQNMRLNAFSCVAALHIFPFENLSTQFAPAY